MVYEASYATNEASYATNHPSSVTSEASSATDEASSVTNHPSYATNEASSVTNHPSYATNEASLATDERGLEARLTANAADKLNNDKGLPKIAEVGVPGSVLVRLPGEPSAGNRRAIRRLRQATASRCCRTATRRCDSLGTVARKSYRTGGEAARRKPRKSPRIPGGSPQRSTLP